MISIQKVFLNSYLKRFSSTLIPGHLRRRSFFSVQQSLGYGNLIVTIYLGQFERCVGIVPQSIKTVVDREPDGVVLKDALPVQRL